MAVVVHVMDDELKGLLKRNDVHDDIIEYLRSIGQKTIKKFANIADTRAEIKTNVMVHVQGGNPPHKDNITELSNLKMAWREAETIVSRILKRSSEGISEEAMDEPLHEDVQRTLEEGFIKKYDFTIIPKRMGCDSLLGRVKREFDKGQITLFPITRVRSLAHVAKDTPSNKKRFGNMVMEFVEDEQCTFLYEQDRVFTIFHQLEVLAMTWAVAGSHDVTNESGAVVKFVHWQHAHEYVETFKERAIKLIVQNNDEASVINFIIQADAHIRAKAIELVRMKTKASYGEALALALKEEHHIWKDLADEVKPQPAQKPSADYTYRPQQPQRQQLGKFVQKIVKGGGKNPSGKQGKGAGKGGKKGGKPMFQLCRTTADGARKYCANFNSRRGCPNRKCPEGNIHSCDVMLANGQPCGAKHSRVNHDEKRDGAAMKL